MPKLYLVVIFLVLVNIACAERLDKDIPLWLEELIQKDETDQIPIKVSEHEYKGERLIFVGDKGACCDLGATLFKPDGSIYCGLIGIAGRWEEKCSDFPKENKLIRDIYESE